MTDQPTVITTVDFAAFIAQPEHQDRRFELINGEIIEKMPTPLHGYIISLLNFYLVQYLLAHPIGYALIETRYSVPDDELNDVIPDLSFVTHERVELFDSGAVPHMPDLAVEAQSDGQSERFLLDKALLYLARGSRMVWIIYSRRGLIEVLTPDERHFLTLDDTLSGGDVLPGFSVAVRDLFPPQR